MTTPIGRGDRGAVMVLMLVVVTLLTAAIGVSVMWVGNSIGSVRRAEQAWVVEESMIAGLRIAAYERTVSEMLNCGEWLGGTYVINEHHVHVQCVHTQEGMYLIAQVGQHGLRAMVAEMVEPGDRWRLAGWDWTGSG
jgi:hypothetical protein